MLAGSCTNAIHPGSSYNPSADAHADALKIVESRRMKEEAAATALQKKLQNAKEAKFLDNEVYIGANKLVFVSYHF